MSKFIDNIKKFYEKKLGKSYVKDIEKLEFHLFEINKIIDIGLKKYGHEEAISRTGSVIIALTQNLNEAGKFYLFSFIFKNLSLIENKKLLEKEGLKSIKKQEKDLDKNKEYMKKMVS